MSLTVKRGVIAAATALATLTTGTVTALAPVAVADQSAEQESWKDEPVSSGLWLTDPVHWNKGVAEKWAEEFRKEHPESEVPDYSAELSTIAIPATTITSYYPGGRIFPTADPQGVHLRGVFYRTWESSPNVQGRMFTLGNSGVPVNAQPPQGNPHEIDGLITPVAYLPSAYEGKDVAIFPFSQSYVEYKGCMNNPATYYYAVMYDSKKRPSTRTNTSLRLNNATDIQIWTDAEMRKHLGVQYFMTPNLNPRENLPGDTADRSGIKKMANGSYQLSVPCNPHDKIGAGDDTKKPDTPQDEGSSTPSWKDLGTGGVIALVGLLLGGIIAWIANMLHVVPAGSSR